MDIINANSFENFSELSACYQRDAHYRVTTQINNSSIAIIAPHGGKIESQTSEIAKIIADENFNLYLFEGILAKSNYQALHLTSTKFDDPQCLQLIKSCDYVISIHGCQGDQELIYLGGLDDKLKDAIAETLQEHNVQVEYDHPKYLGQSQNNICNRGAKHKGVQIEFSKALRESENHIQCALLIRTCLLQFLLEKKL